MEMGEEGIKRREGEEGKVEIEGKEEVGTRAKGK